MLCFVEETKEYFAGKSRIRHNAQKLVELTPEVQGPKQILKCIQSVYKMCTIRYNSCERISVKNLIY